MKLFLTARVSLLYISFLYLISGHLTSRAPLNKESPIKRPRTFTDQESSPLSLPWVHILLALADGERHGYGIMQDVDERTAGHVKLWPATLYGAIRRMLAAGLIEEASPPGRPESEDQRRKYYRLTDSGRGVLAREAGHLAGLVETARKRDVLDTPKPV